MTPLLPVALAVLLQPASAPLPPRGYRVGAGDVLEVAVGGQPSAGRLVIVQTTGVISLAPVGEVPVAGLTVEEIGIKLAGLWSRHGLARPAVQVREYQSQFAWVVGEVNRPGRKALRGTTRLVDALVEAGGFTSRASGEVVIERREGAFADGSTVKRFALARVAGPTPEEVRVLETLLAARDVVTAAGSRYVRVSGAVAQPGRYALKEGTLREALAAAGGVTRRAGRRATVSRIDPGTGGVQVLEVDIEDVKAGRSPGPRLLADDQVVVVARVL
jgi:polysaccharide biosynthesis/export protein